MFFINFREEGREREKHQCEKHQLVDSYVCSDLESNPQPFGVWEGTPTN